MAKPCLSPYDYITESSARSPSYAMCENATPGMIVPWSWREVVMKRFVEREDRSQSTLFPERLDDGVGEDNPARSLSMPVFAGDSKPAR